MSDDKADEVVCGVEHRPDPDTHECRDCGAQLDMVWDVFTNQWMTREAWDADNEHLRRGAR